MLLLDFRRSDLTLTPLQLLLRCLLEFTSDSGLCARPVQVTHQQGEGGEGERVVFVFVVFAFVFVFVYSSL